MVELRRATGYELLTGKPAECGYDEVICDGETIGLSLVGSSEIHWQPYSKKDIPLSIRREAVRLCRERNARQSEQSHG